MVSIIFFFSFFMVLRISLELFVVLDHLVEFWQFAFLVFTEFFHNQGLGLDAVVHLFFELFNGSFHPVFVVEGWFQIFLFELESDLGPYFSDFEMGIHLHNFHFLLLLGIEIIFVEPDSVQDTENNKSDIIVFHLIFDSVDEVGFHAGLGEIFEVGLLLFEQSFFNVLGD